MAGGDKKPVFVSGNSTASDCGVPGSDWAISLTGDLEGCWSAFVQDYKCKELEDYDLYFEEGREVFVGKFHGKQGRFRTTYTFEAAYAKGFCQSFDPTLEVGGGCNHKISGGSGVFADAEGLIKFIDVITGVTGDPVTGEFQAGTWGKQFPLLRPYRFRSRRLISALAVEPTAEHATGPAPAGAGPRRLVGQAVVGNLTPVLEWQR